MTINVRMQTPNNRLKPKITVIGIGGAGGNAVNNMINSQLEGCEFLVCNTDAQALESTASTHKIQLGVNVTRGLGAGANPEIGCAAAEESIEEILAYLEGANMVFVTAGMGGGTGTGAAPVIAQAAREAGILTVGVVTKPFHFEGTHRMKLAEAGIAELQKHVDTLIIIPNQNLFRIANEKTTFSDAFRMADEVLQSGVRGVTDLMIMPGLINLDFADIRAVMAEMGKAMMGTGEAEGEKRAVEAAESAISNPLLDDVSMKGARGVLINITGGMDMTLFEVDEAANRIRDEVDPDANIIFGSTFDASLEGRMRVSVVATGIEAALEQVRPLHLSGAMPEKQMRRPVQSSMQSSARSMQAPVQSPAMGYRPAQQQQQPAMRESFGGDMGGYAGIPAGVMPASGMTRATANPTMMRQSGQVIAQSTTAPTMDRSTKMQDPVEAQEPNLGYAAATSNVAPTATARKLEREEDTWTRPATQNYQRSVPPVSQKREESQPRGMRHGDSFIPPRPVDPRGNAMATTSTADLFGAPAEKTAMAEAEKTAKKSPSLFERFTMRREEPAPAQERPAAAPGLTIETGGKQEEDELDIPAFLRRQAN